MRDSEGKALDADSLVERMRSVRSAGLTHANELQGEVKRLVDWKEYVLSKPIASLAAASVLGFAIVRSTMRVVSKPIPERQAHKGTSSANDSARASFADGALDLGKSIASSAIKSYFANMVQRSILEGGSNDPSKKLGTRSNNAD